MKSIRISDSAYKFLKQESKRERRPLIATLDLFIELFKEVHHGRLAQEGIPSQNGEEI